MRIALEQQIGCTSQQDDPFRLRLIEPLAGRRGLPSRNDPLDPQAVTTLQDVDTFCLARVGQVGEEIANT